MNKSFDQEQNQQKAQPPSRTSLLKRLGRVTLFIALIPGYFLILEGIIRLSPYQPGTSPFIMLFVNQAWLNKDVFTLNMDTFWRFRPHQNLDSFFPVEEEYSIPINSLGFRASPEPEAPLEECYRVMVVGDSCVFGWEAPEGENFPERLLQMLEQEYPNRPFHLFQGGVMGYSTYQTRRILEIYGPEYRPDLVVVYANTNDAWPCVEYPDKEVVNKSMRKYSLQQALEYSEFYCLLRDILRKTGVVFDPENIEMSEVRQQANYHQGPFRVSREDNYENISAMCEFTREELQADIILLTRQHLLRNGILGKRIMGFNDNTRRVAEEKNVPLVDVDLFFSSHPNERELYFRPERDRIHPNTKGYRQIARLVCEKNKIREYNPARC